MISFIIDSNAPYFRYESRSSAILLSFLTVGLAIAFSVLIYSIGKYFKKKMVVEMRWIKILFTVFSLCYGLRTAY